MIKTQLDGNGPYS